MRSLIVRSKDVIWKDVRLNNQQILMTRAARLMARLISQWRERMEGAHVLEKTSMRVRDQARRVSKPIVVKALVNGKEVQALIDTGSMADFISTMVIEQLGLKKETYLKLLSVQLAVHGSRSKINCGVKVKFQYQTVDCERQFDVVNLNNYDVILGTPFIFQHKVVIGLNPPCVVIGSSEPKKMEGPDVVTINSATADLLDNRLAKLRKELRAEADDLCPDTKKTALPPTRAVNHTIPLIDPEKIYKFRRLNALKHSGNNGEKRRMLTWKPDVGGQPPATMPFLC